MTAITLRYKKLDTIIMILYSTPTKIVLHKHNLEIE